MHKFYLELGEHHFEIQADSSSLINLFVSNFPAMKKIGKTSTDMTVHLHYAIPTVYNDFITDGEKSKYTFQQENYAFDINSEYTSTHLYIIDGTSLRQAFMTVYSSFIVHNGWGLLIKAGCVVDHQTAHLLCGEYMENAVNKSERISALESDLVLIKISPERVAIIESPFSIAASESPVNARSLSSLSFLQKSFEDKRIKVGRTYSLLRLLDMVFYWPRTTEQTKNVIHLLKQMVQQVPVFNCYFQNEETVKELIS
ncbi:MAG: hypothetical protein K0Q56_1054 [Sporolactobacillus laevolacticus]|jgi:hypothetical protein|nr:hypothetical protein [Sporolactobacillus laevolacticus]